MYIFRKILGVLKLKLRKLQNNTQNSETYSKLVRLREAAPNKIPKAFGHCPFSYCTPHPTSQRPKNPHSKLALPSGKILRVRKMFARMRKKLF